MKRAAFAGLCSISKMMVSKYEAAGLVVVVDNEVDAEQSLANLEGRLDEEKRLRALTVLKETGIIRPSTTTSASSTPRAQSAKAEKDEIERDLKRLEYGQKAGVLVHVDDVAEQATQAIAAMRETFANAKRQVAAEICARFGIAPDKVTALSRFLGEEFERALGRFAGLASGMTGETSASGLVSENGGEPVIPPSTGDDLQA